MGNNKAADEHLLRALNMASGFSDVDLKKKQAEEIEKALKEGADPNLYLPMEEGEDEHKNVLYDTVHGGTTEVVEILLRYGADPNAPYWFKYDWSPKERISSALHYAVQRGNVAMVRMLVLAGANIELKDDNGKTPLESAKKADVKKLLKLAAEGKLKPGTKVEPAKREGMPSALATFFAKEAAAYKGRGIPDFLAEGDVAKVKFLKKPGASFYEDRDLDPLDNPTYHFLAELGGEEHFLVVDGDKAELPVLRWESETGEFVPVSPSLKEFLTLFKP